MPSTAHLSVTQVDQSKTVKVRIMQFSPYSSPIPRLLWEKFHAEILGVPQMGASNKCGVGKTIYFPALCINISKTVQDTSKVTTNEQ